MKISRVTGPRYSNKEHYDKRVIEILEQELAKEILNRDGFLLNIPKDDISEIAIEISESYKGIFLKKKEDNIIFDEGSLSHIASFIITSYQYYFLVNRLMQFKREKGDFQPLKKYLNAIDIVLSYSNDDIIKNKLLKESKELKQIEAMYHRCLKTNELKDLIEARNEVIYNDTDRNILSGSVPAYTLANKNFQNLKNYIDKVISSLFLDS